MKSEERTGIQCARQGHPPAALGLRGGHICKLWASLQLNSSHDGAGATLDHESVPCAQHGTSKRKEQALLHATVLGAVTAGQIRPERVPSSPAEAR